MAKKNSAMEEYLNKKLNECMAWTAKTTWNINKRILINTGKQLKPVNLKKMFESKEKYVFITVTVGITTYFIVKTYDTDVTYMSSVGLLSYFYGKGVAISIRDQYLKQKESFRISRLNKKYKKLRKLFNDEIDIINVCDEKVVIFSNTLSSTVLNQKKDKFEMFFNKSFDYVIRQKNNYRYTDLITKVVTNFKRYYKFEEYINYISEKSRKNMYLPILLGLDQKNKPMLLDLADIVHLFVSGESGGGKSSIINCLLQSLMTFTDKTIYIIVDLKGGAEMSEYKDFEHTIFIYNIKDFIKIIDVLNREMEERLKVVRNTKRCKNIRSFNNKKKNKNKQYMDIVMVIDEIASLRLSGLETKPREALEHKIIQLLQKARVCNIHLVGATQKPSGEQINTNMRAGFLENISFKVKDKDTQKQTKVYGTEKLKTGEYKTTMTGNEIYKGYLILDTAEPKKKLPKCNEVFENLEKVLIEKIDIKIDENKFKIEEKTETKHNKILQYIQSKLNKPYRETLPDFECYQKFIKQPSKTVIEEVRRLKFESKIDDFSQENTQNKDGDAELEKLLKHLHENQQKNGQIPDQKTTLKYMGFSTYMREKLLATAKEKGFIHKKGKTNYKINENFEGWKTILEK